MKTFLRFVSAVAAVWLSALCGSAAAAGDTIKVGILVEMSGTFASFGQQITTGAKAYMKQNGDTVAGKKVELIIRDTTGPAPDVAKRLAQELIVQDEVDFIAGFGLTPNALAVAPIVTEAKKPTIIMNAATSIITTKSPYIARVSFTLPQVTEPMAQWAYKSGLRKVYTAVADYPPGIDAEKTFKNAFTKLGGEIVGEARIPLVNPEFGPFVQRIKDAKPQALFVFVPAGELAVGFMKAYTERGLANAGIKLITTGDVVDDGVINALGDDVLGVISTHHYSVAHDSPENATFLAEYAKINSTQRPNFMAVGGYDGMAAIYEVIRKLNGNIDGDKAMQVLRGMKWTSPRGPILIDADTRDIVQNVYVREAKKVGGKIYNVEFETFPMVKDPGK
ncbi:MAG TPA: ABC transporter substrate-binding protein [Burkholderiaceae bacterium]|nr:ABC transporter substrate-binding protein [Burkholderiaceae bacterium]